MSWVLLGNSYGIPSKIHDARWSLCGDINWDLRAKACFSWLKKLLGCFTNTMGVCFNPRALLPILLLVPLGTSIPFTFWTQWKLQSQHLTPRVWMGTYIPEPRNSFQDGHVTVLAQVPQKTEPEAKNSDENPSEKNVVPRETKRRKQKGTRMENTKSNNRMV